MSTICQKCGDDYALRDGHEPTTFCDSCAQTILARIEDMTPEWPAIISVDRAAEILNALQKDLHDKPYREKQP